MNESSKNLSTHNGIYIFLNVLECKVYVGQAKKFNKRDHFKILEDGKDNKNLQNDYNKGKEFIYFVVADSETDSKKETLDLYEKLFMTLFEDLGYNLYNTNIARTNRTIEGLAARTIRISSFFMFDPSLPNHASQSWGGRRSQAPA